MPIACFVIREEVNVYLMSVRYQLRTLKVNVKTHDYNTEMYNSLDIGPENMASKLLSRH